jgi:imidazoleglycerol phosphate dehydratase HisB
MSAPPAEHERVRQLYRHALQQLTFNSRPIITHLTQLAGDNRHAAEAVVQAVEDHLRIVGKAVWT